MDVKQLFDYKKGKLFWKSGRRAGHLRPDGYRYIVIEKKTYLEHRLIWLYNYGYLPKEIDHINGSGKDNRIENLRSCTHSQNIMHHDNRLKDNT